MTDRRLRAAVVSIALSGAAGAVPLDPAAPGPFGAAAPVSAAATAADARGRNVAVGTLESREGRSVIVAGRFVGGRADPHWGRGAPTLIEATRADATASDVLVLPDGKVVVAGALDDESGSFAALWRLHADGEPDADFGEGGLLRASALAQSQALSVHRAADGSLLIGVLVRDGSEPWLEVHAWSGADEAPVRRSRQPMPSDRISQPMLTHRSGRWVWVDAAQPDAPGVELVAAAPASLWSRLTGQARAAPAQPEAGHSAMNPFADATSTHAEPAASAGTGIGWPATLGGLTLIVLGWVWRRRP